MTDASYKAKEWLNRKYKFSLLVDAEKRTLEALSARLGATVSRYESDGTECHDPDKARARHEDTLLEYSEQKAKVEKDERELLSENAKTRAAIGQLSDPVQQAVAIDRYINRLRWDDIAKLNHFSVAHVKRIHGSMLEKMATIYKDFE